jgi:hypothetical protein
MRHMYAVVVVLGGEVIPAGNLPSFVNGVYDFRETWESTRYPFPCT